MAGMNGSGADGLAVPIEPLLARLSELHHQQLASTTLEAAKWRVAAETAAAELEGLRARIEALEGPTAPGTGNTEVAPDAAAS